MISQRIKSYPDSNKIHFFKLTLYEQYWKQWSNRNPYVSKYWKLLTVRRTLGLPFGNYTVRHTLGFPFMTSTQVELWGDGIK